MIKSLAFNQTTKNVLTDYCFMLFQFFFFFKKLKLGKKNILAHSSILSGLDKFD